jgi:hypothetical protein
MQAGVKLALRELAALPGRPRPRPHAKKVILFLTDGKPSLPFGLANVGTRRTCSRRSTRRSSPRSRA